MSYRKFIHSQRCQLCREHGSYMDNELCEECDKYAFKRIAEAMEPLEQQLNKAEARVKELEGALRDGMPYIKIGLLYACTCTNRTCPACVRVAKAQQLLAGKGEKE